MQTLVQDAPPPTILAGGMVEQAPNAVNQFGVTVDEPNRSFYNLSIWSGL